MVAARAGLDGLDAVRRLGHPVAAWTVQAETLRGDSAAAARALQMAEQTYGPPTEVFLPTLELARGYHSGAATGDTLPAQNHAEEAARIARRCGMATLELEAVHRAAVRRSA